MPQTLSATVEKALKKKLPKLVETVAHKRILLLERDQIAVGEGPIHSEILKLSSADPDLAKVEIWFVNTCALPGYVRFTFLDARGLVEYMIFKGGNFERRITGPPR